MHRAVSLRRPLHLTISPLTALGVLRLTLSALSALKEQKVMFLFFFGLRSRGLLRFAFEQIEEAPQGVMRGPAAVRIRTNVGFGLSRLSQFFCILRGIGWFGTIRTNIVSGSDLPTAVLRKTDGVYQFVISDRRI